MRWFFIRSESPLDRPLKLSGAVTALSVRGRWAEPSGGKAAAVGHAVIELLEVLLHRTCRTLSNILKVCPVRFSVAATGLVLAACAAVSFPATPHGDTGGGPLYMTSGRGSHLYRATALHPGRRHRLLMTVPRGSFVESVVPSPDGGHLAVAVINYGVPGGGVRVYVTDPRGRHAHRVFYRADGDAPPPNQIREWSTSGLAWARGGHRLYFSTSHDDRFTQDRRTSRLWSVEVSRSGRRIGAVSRVPGGKGLSYPTTDPTSGRVAGVRVDTDVCACRRTGNDTATSTIVLLHPGTRSRQDLLTVNASPTWCPGPVEHLAWSPDGTQIAFDQVALHELSTGLRGGQIDLVAVDGSDGANPRVAVVDDQKHFASLPTWRSASGLWYAPWKQDDGSTDNGGATSADLFSVSVSSSGFGPPVRRTFTPKFSESFATFG